MYNNGLTLKTYANGYPRLGGRSGDCRHSELCVQGRIWLDKQERAEKR